MDPIVAERMEHELIGTSVAGWVPDKLLGNGKSAVVFRAKQGTQVAALKVFDPDLVKRVSEDIQLERINRERRLIGKSHPNLVKIFDGGKCPTTGYLFVAMECIEAPDLAAALTEVPRDRIRPLIAQLASAAKFLESLDLVHRDIKPANIAISADYQQLTLLDLGVIRPFGDGSLTDTERKPFVGTHQYSPPEFISRKMEESQSAWRAVTFYQIGAVLHDLLTRKPLFDDFCIPQAILIHAVENETPHFEGDGLDPDLVLLARNCLVKNAELRLRLVGWESFSSAPPPVSIAAMRDRARRTQAMVQAPIMKEYAEKIALGVCLQELVNVMQGMIRKECFENVDLFPALEVHDHSGAPEGTAEFRAAFPKSGKCGLPNATALTFRVSMLDTNAQIIEMLVGGSVSHTVSAFPGAMAPVMEELFRGAFEENLVRTKIQTALYEALRASAEVTPIVVEEVRSLSLQLPKPTE